MSQPDQSPPLIESVRQLASTLLGLFSTRLEMAAFELEESKRHYIGLLVLALLAAVALLLVLILGSMLVVLIWWDTHRVAALTAVVALYTVIGLGCAGLAWYRSQRHEGLLAMTLAELKKDKDLLQQAPFFSAAASSASAVDNDHADLSPAHRAGTGHTIDPTTPTSQESS